MYAVVDTNQASKLPNKSSERNLSNLLSGITLSPFVLAEIWLRRKPEPTLSRLRQYNFRLGLEPVEVLETVAGLSVPQIVAYEPFAVPDSSAFCQSLMTGLHDPKRHHVTWAEKVKNRNKDFCGLIGEKAKCVREELRQGGFPKVPKFNNVAQVMSGLSFFPKMVAESISNGSNRTVVIADREQLYGAVMRNQYLGRFFKTISYYLISFSRAWRDQHFNFDPVSKRDDWTDMTLPLYAASGDFILTADKKLRNAIQMIEPSGEVVAKTIDELL